VNQAIARQMISADLLKLRRHRPTTATAVLLSVGIAIVYFAFIEARHHGNLAGPQALSDGATLMGIYFGAFAAILVGAEAGTIDLASGVFRDLVATGRSRTALFLVRIPAAITIALAFSLSGFRGRRRRLRVPRHGARPLGRPGRRVRRLGRPGHRGADDARGRRRLAHWLAPGHARCRHRLEHHRHRHPLPGQLPRPPP
jgi:hypothetical protein